MTREEDGSGPLRQQVSAAVVIIGNEILSGKVVDENGPYLARALRTLGVCLARVEVIPDDVEEIASTVTRLRARFDFVFTSGGVGPTHDDRTVEGIAASLGRKVVPHPQLEQELREYYGSRINEAILRMALVPEGALVLAGEGIPIPVVTVENVIVLPGIPELFRLEFESIRLRFQAAPFHSRRVYVSLFESDIVHVLEEFVHRFPEVDLGSYPRLEEDNGYKVMLTLDGKKCERCEASLAWLLHALPAGSVLSQE